MQFSAVMDTLVDPLEKTISHKTKPDAVKQEVDRNEDMIRSALRAIDSLNRIRYSLMAYPANLVLIKVVVEASTFMLMILIIQFGNPHCIIQ